MSDTRSGGIGVAGVLGIIFVCAKIFGIQPIAAWPWVWVLAPFWIGLAIFFGVLAFIGIGLGLGAAFVALYEAYLDRQARKRRAALNKAKGLTNV